MRILRFEFGKKSGWGIIDSDSVRVLAKAPFQKLELTPKRIPLNKIKFLPPVSPGKIILAGLNYKDHARELNMKLPKEPVIFLKPPTSIIGHKQRIIYPEGATRVDFEAELAVIIGKEGRNIMENKVDRHIFGFTCLNDVTERGLQKKDGQWTRAKSFDTFCPIGPWLETKLDYSDLKIRSYLNGRIKQDSSTKNFLFPLRYLIAFISRVMTLLPGDIISTGTPPGVGPMQPGDTIDIEIENIGRLSNKIVF